MLDKSKKIKVILGDICYPKSEAIIIPANAKGIMTSGIPQRIINDGWGGIRKEAKLRVLADKIELGDFFKTGPGRLKRRGLKKIYHLVIKNLQSDFTSVYIVENALRNVFKHIVADGVKTLTTCGVGIEPGELNQKSIALITAKICKNYQNDLEIKIIDDRIEFINEINDYLG